MIGTTIQRLKESASGSVLTPDHPAYDTTRRGWNLSVNHFPALILVAENAQDVVAGVNYARENGLGVSIQTTGHGIQQPADDALLIVMSHMTGVEVDAKRRTARVEGGAMWKHVLEQATPHGLTALLGSAPHVGVVGYTLGGGIGWLARKYGLSADSVRWIEVVTADGELRRASPTENRDLFWALRGGGGNFGVVTALEIDLYPVEAVYGGSLVYPGEVAGDALRFFRDWTASAPDELTSSFQIMNFPNSPQMPEAIRGKTQVIVRAAYTGDPAKGQAYIQQWLDWRKPLVNAFRVTPFSEIGTVSNDPVEPGAGYGSNEMFDTLSDDAIDLIVRQMTDKTSPIMMGEIRHAGGAIARVPADANAIGNRDAQFYFTMGGAAFTPEIKAALAKGIGTFRNDLKPFVRGGGYLNFMSGGESIDRAKDAYLPASYRRLLDVKAKYDPDNLFRYSYQLVTAETARG